MKPGDTVTLNSGGPTMTVDTIGQSHTGDYAVCVWFDGKEMKEKTVQVSSLEIVQEA